MKPEIDLSGRGAVVTGASRGIGAAVAEALAGAGAGVVLAARTIVEIERLAERLTAGGCRAWAIPCDVTDEDSVGRLAEESSNRLGSVDILVNNAGIATSAPLHRQSLAEWNRVMAVNATGTFLCARAFTPAMAQRGWGRVVNIASIAGRTGAPYISAYAASKHAVLGLTRCIAAELAAKGVTANAICPGYVDTEMTHETIERIMSKTGLGTQEAMASVLATTPQHRLIETDEVAHAVLALCADAARGINGQAIGIDGGGFLG
jgi:NAD(P)-dependent dehydrogenase (short-subunit alcohol dehydrogenase family)